MPLTATPAIVPTPFNSVVITAGQPTAEAASAPAPPGPTPTFTVVEK
jgi:hypothetical protein